ncbi:hypothetical protein Rsub_12631 [Raphidocelis subcapitata]|uniref:Phospholipid/glycerol acyltransferase domain-containing protein n=1 Tax=Raphidocelis subcapitata TaxID=307507 RepID=A0A2V0PJG5_9CHLO|nr:hypothetical protein Rsub_12631 [Raphidocelis subcapitata]|eukprot:GBF99938.1 hypothetical protein Rsub_12631 [Raphidocelis subcapitata]
MVGPKTALLKGASKELLRTLKDDSAFLAQADQLSHASMPQWAAAGAQPDVGRAFARVQALWAAGKLRAQARLRQAAAAVERRYEEACGAAGAPPPPPPQQQQQQPHAVAGAQADDPALRELHGANDWTRAAVMYTLAHLGRAWMTVLNTTEVEGAEHLTAALQREPGRALITVSNHVASIDDPFVTAAVVPPELFASPEQLRWTLCASDRCFHRAALVPFFRAAKVLPVERGAGMFQPGLAAAEERLRAGDWVHIFPEGTRSRDGSRIGPARKGVGRLVAACAAPRAGGGDPSAPPPLPPMVVPIVHSGMQEVMPRGALVPRIGKAVRVAVGPPVEVADLLAAAQAQGWAEDELYQAVAARVGLSMQRLKARLDGAGELASGAVAELEAEQAGASGLDLYDPRDAAANRLAGWRAGGAARWVESVRERVAFKASHREAAVRGAAAAALERLGAGAGSGPSGPDGLGPAGGGLKALAAERWERWIRDGGAGGLGAGLSSGVSAGGVSGGGAPGAFGRGSGSPAPWASYTALHGYAA